MATVAFSMAPGVLLHTSRVRQAKDRILNSRAWQEMRRMDANLYTVLSMRSFNRGPPMLPEAPEAVFVKFGVDQFTCDFLLFYTFPYCITVLLRIITACYMIYKCIICK